MSTTSKSLIALFALVLLSNNVDGFVVNSSRNKSSALYMATEEPMGRRSMLSHGFGAVLGLSTAVVLGSPKDASASYSAYANREKDWETRKENGEIKISSSRELRAQLREIAPMNTEKTRIFCPNGPSAAVSPLMENKCGDRLATPSVYGRTTDAVGNSIPGFAGGKYPSSLPGDGSNLNASPLVGGFPEYNAKMGRKNTDLIN